MVETARALALAITLVTSARAQPACPRADLPAYAHNDYANAQPLKEALALGFRGAEADVFLVEGVLRVGHDRRAARVGGTLESLYLAPLQALVARCGQLTVDGRPWLLAIELKEQSRETHDSLMVLLERFRPLLEAPRKLDRAAAPIEVVLVGWHPAENPRDDSIESLLKMQFRVEQPDVSVTTLNARVSVLSVDYGKTIGRWWVTRSGRQRWLLSLKALKTRFPDLLLRVHNVTADRQTYGLLLEAGVDLLGTKQIAETAGILRTMATH